VVTALKGARDFSVSVVGVGICELLKVILQKSDFANKKARNRDDTLADLIEVSMGTPRFRTTARPRGWSDGLQTIDGIGDISLIKVYLHL
jgi:hypothetical protein